LKIVFIAVLSFALSVFIVQNLPHEAPLFSVTPVIRVKPYMKNSMQGHNRCNEWISWS